MQTFLPYPSFADSAACLDYRRLGKQRVECKQIYTALVDPTYGWQSHPAVKMWRGYENALAEYGRCICRDWVCREYQDTLLPWFQERVLRRPIVLPAWVGDKTFHASHRSNLIRKDSEWYGQFGWSEPSDLEYVWPTL